MSHVFLSHSSKDKERVEALAQDLDTAGNVVWFDHKLTGGQAWWDQILEQIRQCDLFIFALTPQSMDSYPCKLEYRYAHSLGKNVLPILLSDGVSINLLPPELTAIQFVDFRDDDRQAAFRLMNALNNLPPAKPLPTPLPEPPIVPISYIGQIKDQLDSPVALSFDEQAALVLKLKDHLRDKDERDDTIVLLKKLRQRNEVYARIAEEIDDLLVNAPKPSTEPPPFQQPKPAQSPKSPVQPQTIFVPQTPITAVATTAPAGQWGTVAMIVLAIATFIIPLVGIVAGVIAMRNPVNRSRGIGLLAFGIVIILIYIISMSSNSYYGY